jgi:malonyl-CoA O-methyltransferase
VSEPDPYRLDPRWVRRSFDRASASYDRAAVLEADVRAVLLERLELTALEPRVVLDAGAGTGQGSRALKRRYPAALVVAADSSRRMLGVAARRAGWLRPFARVQTDAAALPLADASVDLIFSNLMLPWTLQEAVFAEFRRVLAPRGLLTFTTLGPDTLKELRSAWARVDAHIRVGRFSDMHDVGDALVRAGLAAPVLDVEHYTLYYRDVPALISDLRAVGTRNATVGRPRGLTSPRKLAALAAAYEEFRREGRLPATYEVVFGQAWAPAQGAARPDVGIPLEAVRRQLPGRRDT